MVSPNGPVPSFCWVLYSFTDHELPSDWMHCKPTTLCAGGPISVGCLLKLLILP